MSLHPSELDDNLAHPAALRAEIKRQAEVITMLREALLDEGRDPDADIIDEAITVLRRHLCMMRGAPPGAGCACPGACVDEAKQVVAELLLTGIVFARARK